MTAVALARARAPCTSAEPQVRSGLHGDAAARLLTAALGVCVPLQRCDVPVPAQSVDQARVWGPPQQRPGRPVGLGGAEASQVAAGGQVVVERRRQRRLLLYLQQEAKLKGCRERGQTGEDHYRRGLRAPLTVARQQRKEPTDAAQVKMKWDETQTGVLLTAARVRHQRWTT